MDHKPEHSQSKGGEEMSAKIQSALSFIPADHRETWIAIGMAVKSEMGDSGFDVWDEWSRTASNYNPRSALASWRSFRTIGGITAGTLFHEARAHGWRDTSDDERPTQELLQARRRAAEAGATTEGQEIERAQEQAAKKAAWILHQAKPEQHAYLHSKGWPDAVGSVWWPDDQNNLLCIPMRVGKNLVGVQMIDRTGAKKYLKGQRTSGAEFVINNDGRGAQHWYVEGYATGLSLRDCLHDLKLRYIIHVTFSAGNMVKVAGLYGAGFVVADKDESGTGERMAQKTGLPYFMPPVGDFNDMARAMGRFKTSQALRVWLNSQKK